MNQALRRASTWLAILILGSSIPSISAPREYLWQTNARGDDVHIIDVEKRETVRRIQLGPNPHGIATDAAQQTIYISLERDGEDHGELLWIDPGTLAIQHRLPVGPEPHQLAVTPDGRFAYVPCRDERYWVVDLERRIVVKRIHTGGRPHNTTATPDGRYMILSPMGGEEAAILVDIRGGHRVAGRIPFADSIRPPALAADGERFFQHVDGINGFQVASLSRREVTDSVHHTTELGWFLSPLAMLGWLGPTGLQRCHGLAIRPDQTEIWSVCGAWLVIHDLVQPGYAEKQRVELPAKGYWLTFSRSEPVAWIALADSGEVIALDAETRAVLARIPVGSGPKRNLVISR